MAARHFGEIDNIAGILHALFARAFKAYVYAFLNTITVTGRADHGACAAVQALVTPFFPYRGFEFYIQEAWQACHFHFGFKAFLNEFPSFNEFLIIRF